MILFRFLKSVEILFCDTLIQRSQERKDHPIGFPLKCFLYHWYLILNIHLLYFAEDPSKYREPQETSYIRYGRKQTGAVATRDRIPSGTYETGRTIQPAYKSTASYWVSYHSPHVDPNCHRNSTENKLY